MYGEKSLKIQLVFFFTIWCTFAFGTDLNDSTPLRNRLRGIKLYKQNQGVYLKLTLDMQNLLFKVIKISGSKKYEMFVTLNLRITSYHFFHLQPFLSFFHFFFLFDFLLQNTDKVMYEFSCFFIFVECYI